MRYKAVGWNDLFYTLTYVNKLNETDKKTIRYLLATQNTRTEKIYDLIRCSKEKRFRSFCDFLDCTYKKLRSCVYVLFDCGHFSFNTDLYQSVFFSFSIEKILLCVLFLLHSFVFELDVIFKAFR